MTLNEYLSKHGSGAKFAKDVGISHTYLSMLKSGKRKPSRKLAMIMVALSEGQITAESFGFTATLGDKNVTIPEEFKNDTVQN